MNTDEAHEHGHAPAPGGRIAYEITGARHPGTPLLLIRPLGGSMALWGPFRDHLSATRRVLAFDHRPLTTTRSLAHDTLHLLDHLGVARTHVFGISLGGMVATWLAALAPARVHGLVLASTPPWGLSLSHAGLRRGLSLATCLARPRDQIEAKLVHRIISHQFRRDHPGELRRIEALADAVPTSRTALVTLALAGLRHDARAVLPTITAPTLVLVGEHDMLLGMDPPRAVAAAIPGAAFAVIAASGHDLTLERPQTTAARVEEFLATLILAKFGPS